MELFVLGLNHKSAPVDVRERLALSDKDLDLVLPQFKQKTGLIEGVVLSTCNRVEVYGVGDRRQSSRHVKEVLCRYRDLSLREMEPYFYDEVQPGSVAHLFRVACGLDSMVLGETEIFGQVKKAYQKAADQKIVGTVLHRMFQKTFQLGKKVRTQTEINVGSVSVSSVAVDLAEKIFGDLTQKKVMIMGAGEVSESTVSHLVERGTASILASNRSLERAQLLAARFHGEAVPYDLAFERMKEVDIVISSTSAPHPIIRFDSVKKLMHARGQKPIFFIDIAVPRDIEPEIDQLDNVYLYNIDDLKELSDKNLTVRKAELHKCELMIEEEVARFMGWLKKI